MEKIELVLKYFPRVYLYVDETETTTEINYGTGKDTPLEAYNQGVELDGKFLNSKQSGPVVYRFTNRVAELYVPK